MKIVFTATEKGWDAKISKRFGRAEGFSVYDTENKELTWYSNQENKDSEHGVGIQAAQLVVSLNPDLVITGGNFGPKAQQLLSMPNIKLIDEAGEITVREAYQKFKKV